MEKVGSSLIPRSHLLRRLQAALKTGHVFISAPPGYGKSSLLQLLAGQHPNSYLIALDLGDADAGQLQARLQPWLRPGAVLLLDDVHNLQGAHEALGWLVEQARLLPVRLVLSGRQIPLAADQLAGGGVTTFAEHDLAFTLSESEALLAHAGLGEDPELAAWHAHTRGWPLALALLARRPDSLPILERSEGQPQAPTALFEYLAETLVGALPLDVQRFMALTAVPLRFDDELAAALLETDAAQAAQSRADVLRRNLFLGEAEPAGWFRYHDLIRDFMLARLDQFGAERGAAFQQVAAWFESQGDLPMAIEHALAGHAHVEAARLIAKLPETFVYTTGRYRTFQRWVGGLIPEQQAAHPMLLVQLAGDLMELGLREEAWRYLELARQYAQQLDVETQACVTLGVAAAHVSAGQPEAAQPLLESLLANPALSAQQRRNAYQALGGVHYYRSNLQAARRTYLNALAIDAETPEASTQKIRQNLANVALIPLGEFEAAQQQLRLAEPEARLQLVANIWYLLTSCWLYEATGDWPAMRGALDELQQSHLKTEVENEEDSAELMLRALYHTGVGEFDAAHALLTRVTAIGTENPDIALYTALCQTWLARRRHDPQAAAGYASAGLARPWDVPLTRSMLALEYELARFALGSAAHALHSEVRRLVGFRARHWLVRLHALLALRCYAAGNPRWRRHLNSVLRQTMRPGYAKLLIAREPDLGLHLWTVCIAEDIVAEQAIGAVREIGQINPVLGLLASANPAIRRRAARALAAIGREEAMPALAGALAVEKNAQAVQALEAGLIVLEHAPPPTLRVQLMGEFTVRRGERLIAPADWQRPAVRRLFQYFVLQHGQRLSRDQILEDLWAGADPAAARASFNQVFSWLRRVLEPAMRPRTDSRYLTVEDEFYCFDPQRDPAVAQVDMEAFEAVVRPVLAAAEQADLPALPAALPDALARWQPLLPEVLYEGWTQSPRERLLSLYVDGCLYVAQAWLDRARPSEAAPWAARVIAAAPWLEEGYQALMRAQARQGSRSLALKTYETAIAAIQRELSAAPSALTVWLAQRLQRGEEI